MKNPAFPAIWRAVIVLLVCFPACRKSDSSSIGRPAKETNKIFVSPYSDIDSGQLLILDTAGNIIKDKKIDGAVLNFERWDINGSIRYSYFQYNSSYAIPILGTALGDMVIVDTNLNELKRIRLLPNNGRSMADPDALDAHDFILLNDDHYIVMTYYLKTVNNIPAALNPIPDCRVLAPIIQEVKDDKVVWEWDGTDYPEFYANSVQADFSDTAIQDHMHMNSMFIDPRDNNLICSFRNQDQVVKINRTTGDIIWRLGGKNSDFPLTPDQVFLRQHHATLEDDHHTLLLFDNGEAILRPYSRVLEFTLDEATKTVTGFKSLKLPENTFSEYMGSVQKKANTYFIGCGSVPKIMEVDLNTGQIVFQKELRAPSYRAFKY